MCRSISRSDAEVFLPEYGGTKVPMKVRRSSSCIARMKFLLLLSKNVLYPSVCLFYRDDKIHT